MSLKIKKPKYSIVVKLSEYLKVCDKDGIVSCLTQLKNDPKCYAEIAKRNRLDILVPLMRWQNAKILNMTLSILANACMNYDARKQVRDTKIGIYAIAIIQNLKLDSSIHCRACRLIGNLSECKWYARSFCKNGLMEPLALLLKSQTSMQTNLMAVRAVRNIWNFYEASREQILKLKIIKIIIQVLIAADEKSTNEARYMDLVNVCLKAMCVFLIKEDLRCAMQMQGGKNAQGYKCLIQYCNANNAIAMRCLYNLCIIPSSRLILGTIGAIENIITLINNNSDVSKEMLSSLCMFCHEAVHRAKIRIGGGLPLILTLLRDSKYEKYHLHLLSALTLFMHDEFSIPILIEHGMIDILVSKLKVPSDETNDIKKRFCSLPPVLRTGYIYNIIDLRHVPYMGSFSLDFHPEDYGRISNINVSSSPNSTSPLPFDDSMRINEIEDDIYSPICSDAEGEENEEERQEEVESLKSSSKSVIVDTGISSNFEKTFNAAVCSYTALILLRSLTFSIDPIDGLVDPVTIKSLLFHAENTKSPEAFKILLKIVRTPAYFMRLLKQGFVLRIQNLYNAEQYRKQLHIVAETGGAFGDLSSVLLRGEEDYKLTTAVSIPFLIKSRLMLKCLLTNYRGLLLILRVLKYPEHSLYENAIWSICHLAKTLEIRPEVIEKSPVTDDKSTNHNNKKIYQNYQIPTTVTFELDDNTTVDAPRDILCQKSDVFLAMLEGNFSESGKSRVKLRNISKDALNVLILAASDASYEHNSIESLLNAVLLADKFLMTDLSAILTERVVSKFSHQNFSKVWSWARENFCHELKSCCVKTFLTANMTKSEIVRSFHDFSNTEHFDEFLEDIKEIIMVVLCQP